ncbi:hypothetical protein F5141DRAFT_1221571 [Pisolithus sp. B1]|nr:hypothetical protein F5141DRAFT_1221571 [Pisolithus sp. B1]
MDWAQEKLNYPEFNDRIREFRPQYIHAEWQPLITTLFTLSDPSSEDPWPPSSLVEQAMQSHGAPRKHQKMGISKFFNLAATKKDSDEDDEEEEDFGETPWRASIPMNAGLAGKHSFNQAIDSMMAQYSGTCSAEVWNHFPPSYHSATKEIILLPPAKATSLAAFEAQQMLPIWTWVHIKKDLYKGNIGFVETSNQTDVTLIVAPYECLYDLPQQSGEKSLFSSELVTLASLALEPIVSPVGEDIGFRCGGHDFIHGLLCLTVPTHSVILVELPIPNDIAFHMVVNFEQTFVEKMVHLFSAQFWQEFDTVKICEGELSGSRGKLINVEWQKWAVSVLLHSMEAWEGDLDDKDEAIHCCIWELHGVFSTGQTVRIIAVLKRAAATGDQ